MTPFTIEPQPITVYPERVVNVPAYIVTVNTVRWTTIDDPFLNRLTIRVQGPMAIIIEGAEYEALGQWSDTDIKAIVLAHYGFVEA